MDSLLQDLRYTLRGLAKTPGFSAAAVLTLTLAIGANTAIFSLLNAMLYRPLPVRDPHQLVTITADDAQSSSWPQPVWMEIRDRQILDQSFAWVWSRFDTSQGGQKQFVDGIEASGGIFKSLGVMPALGRLFTLADEQPGGGPDGRVAVISYRFWSKRFGRSLDVLGRTITINRQAFTIVGVTPPEFAGLNVGLPFDLAIPLVRDPADSFSYVWIMGRLRAGQRPEAITAQLRAQQPQIRDKTNPYDVAPYRDDYLRTPFTVRSANSGVSFLRRRYEEPLKILLGIVGVVLLIGCGNIAALLIARTSGRRHELAVRTALGESRARLARQVLIEGLLLSTFGAAAGVLFAQWCTSLIVNQLSTQAYTVFLDLSPDWRVLGFTIVVVLTSTLLFSTGPALRAAHADPMDALRQHGMARRRSFAVGSIVVVAHVALSLTLIATTALFLRTFIQLAATNVGFSRDRILVVSVDAGQSRTAAESRASLYARVQDTVRGASGVESAALSIAMPGGNSAWTPWIDLEDGTPLPQGPNGVYGNRISAGWFQTLGTRIIAGREFSLSDRAGATKVVVVNEEFVSRFMKSQPVIVIGQTIFERRQPDGPREPLQIVGVVENAMYRLIKEPPPPAVYTSIAQMAGPLPASLNLSVQTRDASSPILSRSIVEAIGRVDPDISLTFRPLAEQVSAQYAQERLLAGVATSFGILALLLAAIGLYGVTAFSVTRRRVEIGIRLALGASRVSIIQLVLGRVTILVSVGVVVGLLGSFWSSEAVKAMLYNVEPRDVPTYAAACALLLLVATVAAWIPTRQATRINPLMVIRYE